MHFRWFFIPLTLAFLSLLVSPAGAEFRIETTHAYYDIAGTSVRELKDLMYAKGREELGCKKCFARTKWNVDWRYKYKKRNGVCRVTQAKVTARIIYTLPRWINKERAAPELRQEWGRMIKVLTAHEENHGSHAIHAAREVERTFLKLAAERCRDLKKLLSETGKRIISEGNAKDDAYDDRTDHGRTEGGDLRVPGNRGKER